MEETSYVSRDSFTQQGFIKVNKTGRYRFNLPEGVKGLLRIHHINVLDRDSKQKYPNENTLNLEAGLHPFSLYLQSPSEVNLLEWQMLSDNEAESMVIPTENYFHQ